MIRLQKFLAEAGLGSRRKCEEIIITGRVKVNDIVVNELGTKVDPEKDIVKVDDKIIKKRDKVYIVLNKPEGYITSVKDQFNRPTVLDLLRGVKERVFPVGRLDYNTSGLLILTNDGDLSYKITHPKHKVVKTYIALIKGIPDEADLERFRKGLKIEEDFITSPAEIEILKTYKNSSLVRIKIHEGRNRQIRKMCAAIGHPVMKLTRESIGKITLGGLKKGDWRYLTDEEIEYLKNL